MKLSLKLDKLINDMESFKYEYEKATDIQSYCDKLQQDLLHELERDNLSYHEIAKLGKELKETRERRRIAKDIVKTMTPLKKVIDDQQYGSVINKLKGSRGAVAGIENKMKEREYKNRV